MASVVSLHSNVSLPAGVSLLRVGQVLLEAVNLLIARFAIEKLSPAVGAVFAPIEGHLSPGQLKELRSIVSEITMCIEIRRRTDR